MNRKLVFVLLLSLVATGICEQKPVVKPRAKAQEYPAVQDQPTATLGVAQLSPSKARKALVSNLRKNYVVIEVGVYPKRELQISPRDFTLRPKGQSIRIAPADPEKMAYDINNKDQQGHDFDVYPTVGVEYSTGSNPNDPYYEGRDRGLTVSKGVMVGVNNRTKTPKASAGDVKAMTAELKEKGLPEGAVSHPVAGYVYFPVNSSQAGPYELVYEAASGPVVIDLPTPRK
jgi:hypothetical protein